MIGDDLEFETVFAVQESWNYIKTIPNYAEVAGEILFRKIFGLASAALTMFSFGPEFVGNEEALYQSIKFKVHAKGVVNMLDQAVNMLGPDLEPVLLTLTTLGGAHVKFGVLPAHYGIVGEALIYTLKTALGDRWTPRVRKGWTLVYGLVSTAMMLGADRRLAKKRRQHEKKNGGISAKKNVGVAGDKGAKESLTERRLNRGKRPTSALRLSEVTGIKALDRTTPDNSRQEKVSRLLNAALDVASDDSSTCNSSTTCESTGPFSEEVSQAEMVEVVYETWDIVRKIRNYQEVAGVLLFRKIFEIAPGAKALFKFTERYGQNDDALYSNPDFLIHAKRVVNMLDVAVNMLGPDLGPVTHALHVLGAKHVGYGVLPEHYPIVGQALLSTLEAALGEAWTTRAKDGWTYIYDFVSTTMIAGASYEKRSLQNGIADPDVSKDASVTNETDDATSNASTIEVVYETWEIVRNIPNYQEVAGVLLFRKIFEIAPGAKALFKFTERYGQNDDALYSNPDFLIHAKRVVNMLDVAVNMLGPDLGPVTHALHVLGAKHVGYGVLPEHYPIVGQALLSALEAALGEAWTTRAKDGWTYVYDFVSTTMIAGANYEKWSLRNGIADPDVSKDASVTNETDDETSNASTIELVFQSWEKVRMIPNYQEVVGVLLFGKIFEIAPGARALFDFTKEYSEDDENLYNDPRFRIHARRVVDMLDVAVNMLGPDLGPVTHALHVLGAKHVGYGVLPEHYPIVGQALLSTLETALGNSWTPKVKNGWVAIFDFVSSAMIAGAKYDAKSTSVESNEPQTSALPLEQ